MAQHAAAAKQRPDAHEDYYVASQWRLMWWKFTRHKPAVASGLLIVLLYLLGVFCEFVSPYDPEARHIKYVFAPPQRIHFFDSRGFHLRPFVYDMKSAIDRETLRKTFREDPSRQFGYGSLLAAKSTSSGDSGEGMSTSSASKAKARSSCSERIGWAAMCSPGCFTAPESPCR